MKNQANLDSIQKIENFDELEACLRNWRSFADPTVYDFVGSVCLFAACLDNLRTYALEAELDVLKEGLDKEQIKFLKKIADIATSEFERS
jgi:hypothetical protein